MDRRSVSGLACDRCGAMGHLYFVARTVRSGAAISVLAANLHIAAALLGRLSGPSIVGLHVPAVCQASAPGSRRGDFAGRKFVLMWALGAACAACWGQRRFLPPPTAN